MVAVTFGSDTYGKVKQVSGTPVVTKFGMLWSLPLIPLESYFYAGPGPSTFQGIPFVFGIYATAIRGLPLARIDKLSVAMAYCRGFCGALAVVGFLSIVPGIMYLTGEQLDDFAVIAAQGLVACLIGGIVGGLLSYSVPFQVTARQRAIRRACEEILGICADPALVRHDVALEIEKAITGDAQFVGSGTAGDSPSGVEKLDLCYKLCTTRLKIALGGPQDNLEQRTDELLTDLGRAAPLET